MLSNFIFTESEILSDVFIIFRNVMSLLQMLVSNDFFINKTLHVNLMS